MPIPSPAFQNDQEFSNLSATQTYRVEDTVRPTSEREVIDVVETAARNGELVRPSGGRHSWAFSVMSPTDSTEEAKVKIVDTRFLLDPRAEGRPIGLGFTFRENVPKDWRAVDPDEGGAATLIAVPPGINQSQLANLAAAQGRGLPVSGAIKDSIRVGGFLTSGCHGTGHSPPVSDYVEGYRLVVAKTAMTRQEAAEAGLDPDADAQPIVIASAQFESAEVTCPDAQGNTVPLFSTFSSLGMDAPDGWDDEDLIRFARVNFGSLGIVTEIYLRTQPLEELEIYAVDRLHTMHEVFPRPDPDVNADYLKELWNDYQYLEFFYTPFNGGINTGHNDKLQLKLFRRPLATDRERCLDVAIDCVRPTLDGFWKSECCLRLTSRVAASCLLCCNPATWHWNLGDCCVCLPDFEQRIAIGSHGVEDDESFAETLQIMGLVVYQRALSPSMLWMISRACLAYCFPASCNTNREVRMKTKAAANPFSRKPLYYKDVAMYEAGVPERLFDFEMELPFKPGGDPEFQHFRRAWWWAVDFIRHYGWMGKFPVSLVLHVRFNQRSRSPLSSCYTPEGPTNDESQLTWFATIEFLTLTPWKEGLGPDNYRQMLRTFTRDLAFAWLNYRDPELVAVPYLMADGTTQYRVSRSSSSEHYSLYTSHQPTECTFETAARPHFAKVWSGMPCLEDQVARLYGDNIKAFEKLRQQLDPTNRFNGGLVKDMVTLVNRADAREDAALAEELQNEEQDDSTEADARAQQISPAGADRYAHIRPRVDTGLTSRGPSTKSQSTVIN